MIVVRYSFHRFSLNFKYIMCSISIYAWCLSEENIISYGNKVLGLYFLGLYVGVTTDKFVYSEAEGFRMKIFPIN